MLVALVQNLVSTIVVFYLLLVLYRIGSIIHARFTSVQRKCKDDEDASFDLVPPAKYRKLKMIGVRAASSETLPQDVKQPAETEGDTATPSSPRTIQLRSFEPEFFVDRVKCSAHSLEEKAAEKQAIHTEGRVKALRQAAGVHRLVRQTMQRSICPGQSYHSICSKLEALSAQYVSFDSSAPLARSWAFPTGFSVNHIAAHDSAQPYDRRTLLVDDLVKLDFGVQVNGHIIDSAWSFSFSHIHDTLLEAVKDATNSAIKEAGVDVRLCDIGAVTSEVMGSYEVSYGGKTVPVRPISNLTGHNILPYKIHGGRGVPQVRNMDTSKMKEGEVYAIETFGSSGGGQCVEASNCSHYMRAFGDPYVPMNCLLSSKARQLLNYIDEQRSTLAFCKRWIHDGGLPGYDAALDELCGAGLVNRYPPLVDTAGPGAYTAQYEHTIYCHPAGIEVLSRGDDY